MHNIWLCIFHRTCTAHLGLICISGAEIHFNNHFHIYEETQESCILAYSPHGTHSNPYPAPCYSTTFEDSIAGTQLKDFGWISEHLIPASNRSLCVLGYVSLFRFDSKAREGASMTKALDNDIATYYRGQFLLFSGKGFKWLEIIAFLNFCWSLLNPITVFEIY